MNHTLVSTLETFAAVRGGELVLGPPSGYGWLTLAEATARASEWFEALVEKEGDRRAAASYLSGWLAQAPILAVGLPAVLGEVAPRVTADRLWVHRHADGWFDRHAIDPVDVRTGPIDDVLAAAGPHVAELTAPVVDPVCAELPVGPVAMWGTVADAVGAYALYYARELGLDELETWRRCEALLDAIQAVAPRLRHRPHLFPVPWSGGTAHYPVRGTCCLYYRTCDKPDPDGEGYCATCPLRTDASRIRRLRSHLEAAS